MLRILFVSLWLAGHGCSQSQPQSESHQDEQVGGPCEGCEAVYEYGNRILSWNDTLSDFHLDGPKIHVSGTVYTPDGVTPAKDVIIYLYHTDQTGRYTPTSGEKGWGLRHGSLRTWLKTDAKGRYAFSTMRPASYPGSTVEAHIHVTIKEPGKTPYWIDEFLFEDDPFLTSEVRRRINGRGGFTGILKEGDVKNGVTHYTRDIFLGKNVY